MMTTVQLHKSQLLNFTPMRPPVSRYLSVAIIEIV